MQDIRVFVIAAFSLLLLAVVTQSAKANYHTGETGRVDAAETVVLPSSN
ncbi:hypothetical protein KHP62_03245 [Rhodobacteraceae bacterium NNCM2]|nr:hypothetical protein [Coraliihabitans acroporae]